MPFHNPKPRNPDPNQPISPDKVITADQIIKTFENEVIKPILDGVYHSTNIPTRVVRGQTYQCVPSEMLGSNDYFEPGNNIWNELAISGDIVSVLINITSMFTNIGTFSWVLYETFKDYPAELNVANGTTEIDRFTGRVIFNKDRYTRTLAPLPNSGGVAVNTKIESSGLLTLMQACLTAWRNTEKASYSGSNEIVNQCHTNCRECHDKSEPKCHSDCYTAPCNCYTEPPCHSNNCHSDCNTPVCHTDCYSECYSQTCYGKTCFDKCHSACNGCQSCYSGMSR